MMNLKQKKEKKKTQNKTIQNTYLFVSEQIQIELLLSKLHLIHSPVDRLPSFILTGNTSSYG